ncbi:hypothetical protein ACCO45_005234 [Purpureocillium lilacinum]|uniref:Uncharacterized protein n=1 Tax=Purpureocillium lilacinum TaxID=33203 RepID=A0ACC4DVJ7_PURLI
MLAVQQAPRMDAVDPTQESLFDAPDPAPGAPLLSETDSKFLSSFFEDLTANQYNMPSFGEGLNFSDAWLDLPPQFMGTATSFGPQSGSLDSSGDQGYANSNNGHSNSNAQLELQRMMSGSSLMPPPPPPPSQPQPFQQQHSDDVLSAAATLLQNGSSSRGSVSSRGVEAAGRGYPVGHLRHQPMEEFKEENRRSSLVTEHDNTFTEWMWGSKERTPVRKVNLGDIQWGSDSNFGTPQGYVPEPHKDPVNGRSPLEPRDGSDYIKREDDPNAPPRKRRKSKNAADEDEDDEVNSSKSGKKRKPRSERNGTSPLSDATASSRRRKSTANGAKPPRENLTEEQKRENHIRSEQKRRTLIKEGFDDLGDLVPGLKGGGFSKSTTLAMAAEWLEDLLRGNKTLAAQRDDERYPTAVVTDNYASGLEVADQQHVDPHGRDKLTPEEVSKDDVDKQAYDADKGGRGAAPARACCGLKRRTFLIVVAVAAVIVIGAVVGGVVGGLRANKDSDDNSSTGSGPGSDSDAPQPTWTGTGPAPIPTGPIQPSQRSLAVSASADNETQELQLFYQDLGTTDVLLRRIRNDEARTEHKLNLTIPPDWGTSLAAAAVNGTGTGSGSSTTDPVSTQLFYISSAGRANASVVQATLECPPRGETCATRSNTVVSANVTGHRVNARTRLAALRIGGDGGGGGGILRVYYQAEDGSLSVLNGDRAASSGWTTTLVRTGVYMSSAIVAHGPDKDDLSFFSSIATYSGRTARNPSRRPPARRGDPSVSMAGVFVPGLSPRRLFYAQPSNGTMVAYYKPGADFRSSTDPNWGTVDGGLAAAAWARQTRVYYFQGKDLVVSVQNVTGWEKPKVL